MTDNNRKQTTFFLLGVLLTFIIALVAGWLAKVPYLDVVGQLVLAIIIGIIWNHTIGLKDAYRTGVSFSSKKLLRLGIILLGLRLNLTDIYDAGITVFLYAALLLGLTLVTVYGLARLFKVDKTLSLLTACGTAICGAAAIVAIAPLLKAKDHQVAVSVAVIAVLGTLFTLIYTVVYPILPLSDYQYGIFAGGTLHEIAHAIAASTAGGTEAEDIAVVVKLTRVALLVPVALLIGIVMNKQAANVQASNSFSLKTLPIPWFILGFLMMSAVNTSDILPTEFVEQLITVSYLLLAMAMAGLGLNVELKAFKQLGMTVFYAGLIGSISLVALGLLFIYLLNLG
ncbi:membrane protein YeiH [Bacillus sp. JCM 19046]|nr:membrane protein YeiH [Bacillus sp. JCM 19046]